MRAARHDSAGRCSGLAGCRLTTARWRRLVHRSASRSLKRGRRRGAESTGLALLVPCESASGGGRRRSHGGIRHSNSLVARLGLADREGNPKSEMKDVHPQARFPPFHLRRGRGLRGGVRAFLQGDAAPLQDADAASGNTFCRSSQGVGQEGWTAIKWPSSTAEASGVTRPLSRSPKSCCSTARPRAHWGPIANRASCAARRQRGGRARPSCRAITGRMLCIYRHARGPTPVRTRLGSHPRRAVPVGFRVNTAPRVEPPVAHRNKYCIAG